jgi:hypothetical protein
VKCLGHHLATASGIGIAPILLVAVLKNHGPAGDGAHHGTRALNVQPDRGERRSTFGCSERMVVVPGDEGHARLLGEARERVHRPGIGTRRRVDERSDRSACG